MRNTSIVSALLFSIFGAAFSIQAVPAFAHISTPAEKWMAQYDSCLTRYDADIVLAKVNRRPPHSAVWDTFLPADKSLLTTIEEQKTKSGPMNETDYRIDAFADDVMPNAYYVEEVANEEVYEMMILSPTAPLGKNLPKISAHLHTTLGIHLGSTKKQVRALLGQGLVTAGCGSESWTYPSGDHAGDHGNPTVMIYVFRNGKIVEIAK